MTVTPFTPRAPADSTAYVGVVERAQRQLWERGTACLREAAALEAADMTTRAPERPPGCPTPAAAREEAARLFQESNDLGTALPLDERRWCRLTGKVAGGHARVPGTDWDADLALSHGRDEPWPTALHRWCGYTDPGGHYHPPERPTLRAAVRQGHLVLVVASAEPHGPRQGGEALRSHFGLRKNTRLRVEFRADGVVELHPDKPVRPTRED